MQADRNTPYTVQKGDCLWDLSQRFYNDPTLWPVIFNYNNQPRVVCETGTVILDPDLILVGQKLVIPAANKAKAVDRNKMLKVRDAIIANRREHSGKGVQESRQIDRMRCTQPAPPKGGEPMARKKARSIVAPVIEVDLGKIDFREIRGKGVSVKIELAGKLLIRTDNNVDMEAVYKGGKELELSAKSQAESKIMDLVSDTKLSLVRDSKNNIKGVMLNSGLATHINGSTEIKVDFSTDVFGNAKLTGSADFKMAKGVKNGILAEETITASITVKFDDSDRQRRTGSNPEVTRSNLEEDLDALWKSGGLIVSAVAIVGAAILTDIFIPIAGFGDDFVAVATAARLVLLAGKLSKGVWGRLFSTALGYAKAVHFGIQNHIVSVWKWLGLGFVVSTPAMAMPEDSSDLVDDE